MNSPAARIMIAAAALAVAVLAAAPGAGAQGTDPVSFGVIGMGGGAFEALKSYEQELNVRMAHLTAEKFRTDPLPDLSGFDVVYTSFAPEDLAEHYRRAVTAAFTGIICR